MDLKFPMIRKLEPSDIEALSALHVASWKGAYQGLLPDSFLVQHGSVEHWMRIWGNILTMKIPTSVILVAEEQGQLLGYFNGGPTYSGELKGYATSEVHGLYLHPDHQGKGVGSQLLSAGLSGLREKGFSSAALWVFSKNPAVEFYRRRKGQELEIENSDLEVGGELFPRRFFRWLLQEHPVRIP